MAEMHATWDHTSPFAASSIHQERLRKDRISNRSAFCKHTESSRIPAAMIAPTATLPGLRCHSFAPRQPRCSQIGALHWCTFRRSHQVALRSPSITSRRGAAAAAAPKSASIEELAARDKLLDTLLQVNGQEEVSWRAGPKFHLPNAWCVLCDPALPCHAFTPVRQILISHSHALRPGSPS